MRDVVELRINGESLTVWEEYTVEVGVMDQPKRFTARCGQRRSLREIAELASPGAFFELYINGCLQFIGYSDGTDNGPGDSITIEGRCPMQFLNDNYVRAETSYKNVSFAELVKHGLDATHGPGRYNLVYSNGGNVRIMQGSFSAPEANGFDVQAQAMTWDTDQFIGGAKGGRKKGAGARNVQAKLGQRWWADVIKPEIDRGGLFLWSSAVNTPTFVLGAPDIYQQPSYEFRRLRKSVSESGDHVNVIDSTLRNKTTRRFTRCEVHFRNGGGSTSRETGFGVFVDDEMTALFKSIGDDGFEHDRPLIVEDKKCRSLAQANFLARRKIAEANREGWQYTATIAGHTMVGINGDVVVVVPDTLAVVRDDERGVYETCWIESVTHRGGPQATSTVRMMRASDCLFGEPDGFDPPQQDTSPSASAEPDTDSEAA